MTWTGNWPLGSEAWKQLIDEVGAKQDWKLVEGLLVDAIRRASEKEPGTIGSNCMSVLLKPWQFPNALVRFLPKDAHQAEALGRTVEIAYTPWLVAADAIHTPAVMVGGLSCAQGLLTYSLEAPLAPDDQGIGAFQTQDRPAA